MILASVRFVKEGTSRNLDEALFSCLTCWQDPPGSGDPFFNADQASMKKSDVDDTLESGVTKDNGRFS